jgi:hypothetical protein
MSLSVTILAVSVSFFDGTGAPLPGDWHVGAVRVQPEMQLSVGRHRVCAPSRECFDVYIAARNSPRRVTLDWRRPMAGYGVALRRSKPFDFEEQAPEIDALAFDGYSLSDERLPQSVRVARHADNDCRNPIDGIDEVPLESYVAGVVNAEIGVFAAAGSGDGVLIDPADRGARVAASFETFAVAARTYVVWWVLRRGEDAEFHIHDGPCNQVYRDARSELASQAAAVTEGLILSPSPTDVVIDKHEYASSCARHGTLPSYRDANSVRAEDIVPDEGLDRVCVRTWCGHDNERMAHQDNPTLPEGNRCLVRGICQWGSLERSVRGDSFRQILAHYQPDLAIVRPGETPPIPDAGSSPPDPAADAGRRLHDSGPSPLDSGASSRPEPMPRPGINACGCSGDTDLGWSLLLLFLLRQQLASRSRRAMGSPR